MKTIVFVFFSCVQLIALTSQNPLLSNQHRHQHEQKSTANNSRYVWDFENGLQGWTHTNGLAYPQGWRVRSSGTHLNHAPPSAGFSCMWIDSRAGGNELWMQDSALSPVMIPNSTMDWMKYGICNHHIGNPRHINEIHVGIKYKVDGVWRAKELAYYSKTAAFGPVWDSVDVSAYANYEYVQAYFHFDDRNTWGYWACFDNVSVDATPYTADHDVGCIAVINPPQGPVSFSGEHNITGHICNLGTNAETFDVRASVYNASNWVTVFDQTLTLSQFTAGEDTNLTFGTMQLDLHDVYYTEIYTLLGNDVNPSNDTSVIYTYTVGWPWQYELNITAATGDNMCTDIEFDGTYFYITGANNGIYPSKVYVIDTTGNLVAALNQPPHVMGWGWRYFWWDHAYPGPGAVGYFYAKQGGIVDQFSVNPQSGFLTHYGFNYVPSFLPLINSVAYMPDSEWHFSPTPDSIYKWTYTGVLQAVANPGHNICDGAYDTDTSDGCWIWWHSQDDPGTGFNCRISQMDAHTMDFTGLFFGYSLPSALTDAIAGGICFHQNFRYHDVIFTLVQGTPYDYIIGIPIRTLLGITEKPTVPVSPCFGFNGIAPNPTRSSTDISFEMARPSRVALTIYDSQGRSIRRLFVGHVDAVRKTIHWDGRDDNQRRVVNGCYFIKLEAGTDVDVQKIIFIESVYHEEIHDSRLVFVCILKCTGFC